MSKLYTSRKKNSNQKISRPVSCRIIVDKDRCKACELCIFYCPTKYLKQSLDLNKKGVKYIEINPKTNCIGCGFCFFICPETCIEVHEE
ncbi:MAG: 4Fe-4S binding protein [Candidatus Omnitrophica bacterium]|nr:4Fe-4S binding protein [Candidatus Omnitrophota bacterium]